MQEYWNSVFDSQEFQDLQLFGKHSWITIHLYSLSSVLKADSPSPYKDNNKKTKAWNYLT